MSSENKEAGLVEKHGSWDGVYREMAEEELPWNAGAPDSDLVTLIESGKIPKGRALDLGVGPGHDAAFLAKSGYQVTAVDISPAAIRLAKKTARAAGVEDKINFLEADILHMRTPSEAFGFIYDRGCFHIFPRIQRPLYMARINRAFSSGGIFMIRTFSDKVPPGPGPHRFTKAELLENFEGFELLSIKESVFEGPRRPEAWLAVFRKIR